MKVPALDFFQRGSPAIGLGRSGQRIGTAADVPPAITVRYSESTRSSTQRRVSLFKGWAMSLNSPFFFLRLGMLMKSPSRPWITLMSLTMKQ